MIVEGIGGRVYSLQELAEMFKLTERTIRGYITSGRLAGQKVGQTWYVTSASLSRFLEGERATGRGETSVN